MKTLIAIMAHAAIQDTFDRHFPYWIEHTKNGDAEILLIFPEGHAIRGTGQAYLEVGKPEHDGIQAIKRFRTILEHMAGLPAYDRFCFLEYDSFILGPLPETTTEFAGNIFNDDNPSWIGRSFVHPPFLIDGNALRKTVKEIQRMPLNFEAGMWDRMLGLATERAQLTRKSWIHNGYGYSQNTIHEEHFPQLNGAILNGAHALHGIKDEQCLKVVEKAWATRKKIDELEAEGYTITKKESYAITMKV